MALVPLAVSASFLEKAQIETAARGFLSKGVGAAVLEGRALSSVEQRGNLWIARYSPSGHAVFSGSDRAEPVVGFSPNDFAEPEEGSAFYDVLEGASEGCARLEAEEEESEAMAARRVKWRQLLGGGVSTMAVVDPQPSAESVIIAPFLTTHWSQCQPYNDYAPVYMADLSSASNYDKYYRGRTPSGCVATVAAQMFNYWKWPARIDKTIEFGHKVVDWQGNEWVHTNRFDGSVPFDWDALSDSYAFFDYDKWTYDLRGYMAESNRYAIARLCNFCDTIAEMEYGAGGSGAYETAIFENSPWYEGGTRYAAGADGLKDATLHSLSNGIPVLVAIYGHVTVGHGWASADDVDYIYINYGWGTVNEGYYYFDYDTSDFAIDSVYTGFKPRPAVQLDPIPSVSSNAVTISWHTPNCWTNSFAGYSVCGFTAITNDLVEMVDDFTVDQGVSSTDLIAQSNGSSSGDSVLGVFPRATGTYSWKDRRNVLTPSSSLSYRIASVCTLNHRVTVEGRFDGGDWVTVSAPELVEEWVWPLEWTTVTVDLSAHAGELAEFRIRSEFTYGTYYNLEIPLVSIDDFTLSNVFELDNPVFKAAARSDRSRVITGLEAETKYWFSVTPRSLTGDEAYEESNIAVTVTEGAGRRVCEKAEMLGVSASGPDFQEGFFRECRMDVPSTFEVVCSAATAGLEALPSALSLVPDSAVAIVTNNVADGTRSFTVTINPSIPDAFERTRMILTLAAYDANGDAVYKDLSLRFSKEDFSEPEIAAIAIDSNGGAAGDGNVYVEIPVEWFCSCGLVAATAMPTVEDCIAAANEDTDGDGLLNWQEYICGTDPNNADEKLTAAISFDAAGNVVVESNLTAEQESLANARGFTVKVQGKATLNASESWTEQASTHRFFRIVVERAQ